MAKYHVIISFRLLFVFSLLVEGMLLSSIEEYKPYLNQITLTYLR